MANESLEQFLQGILNELKGVKAELKDIKASQQQSLTEQQTTNQRLLALETDTKFTHSVLGELQGDIEELSS